MWSSFDVEKCVLLLCAWKLAFIRFGHKCSRALLSFIVRKTGPMLPVLVSFTGDKKGGRQSTGGFQNNYII